MAKSKQKSDSGKVYSGLFADYMEKMVNWHLSLLIGIKSDWVYLCVENDKEKI